MRSVPLFFVAHSRAGDKANALTMSLIPYQQDDYAVIEQQVTVEAVIKHFDLPGPSKVFRYSLPRLAAFNFVFEDVLDGGVNDSMLLDRHGKSRSSFFLTMDILVPPTHPSINLQKKYIAAYSGF